MTTKRDFERLITLNRGLLWRHRARFQRIEKRLDQHDQAILELAAALREAGIPASEDLEVLPSASQVQAPASQNADPPVTLSP